MSELSHRIDRQETCQCRQLALSRTVHSYTWRGSFSSRGNVEIYLGESGIVAGGTWRSIWENQVQQQGEPGDLSGRTRYSSRGNLEIYLGEPGIKRRTKDVQRAGVFVLETHNHNCLISILTLGKYNLRINALYHYYIIPQGKSNQDLINL